MASARMKTAAVCDQCQAATSCDRQRFLSSHDFRSSWQRYALPFECLSFGLILFSNRQGSAVAETARRLTHTSRVPCTKVLSQKIQIFQETSFCVLQVLLLDFTNTIWQLYTDFYTIRIVFETSFQLCSFRVTNLKKLRQFWQKCVDRTFVHVKHGAV